MKIIDEKGKLFGKINVIDFLVILSLLSILPVFYFGYKLLTRKPTVVVAKKEYIRIEVDCQLIKLKPELIKLISVGDKELDEDGEVIGEIISLGESVSYKPKFDIGKGQKVVEATADLKQLRARLKLKAKIRQDGLYYKDQLIKIDVSLEFVTDSYILAAIPFKKATVRLVEKMVDLYVVLKELGEDTLKKISAGDKEVDEDGKTIAEILSLGKIENSSLELNLGSGNFVMGEDSNKKQISTKMRLKCQIKDNSQLYFRGGKVESDTFLEFETDKYKVMGQVAETFEVLSLLKEKWISLQVKFSGVAPEIANIIQKGNMEKDPFEKTLAMISSVISNKPSEILTIKEDEFITLNHPFNKDILISLDVQCIEKEGMHYFKNYPVKMGNNIVFATDLYSISGTVVGLEMK